MKKLINCILFFAFSVFSPFVVSQSVKSQFEIVLFPEEPEKTVMFRHLKNEKLTVECSVEEGRGDPYNAMLHVEGNVVKAEKFNVRKVATISGIFPDKNGELFVQVARTPERDNKLLVLLCQTFVSN